MSERKKQLLFELGPTELAELNGQGNGKDEAEMKNEKEEGEETGKARGDEAASRMEINTPKASWEKIAELWMRPAPVLDTPTVVFLPPFPCSLTP